MYLDTLIAPLLVIALIVALLVWSIFWLHKIPSIPSIVFGIRNVMLFYVTRGAS